MDPAPLNETVRRLITSPGDEIGRLARLLHLQAQLWRYCAKRLHSNNLMAMAAALSFRTIFALVPTLVLAFLAAGALGVLEDSKHSLRQFLDATGFSTIAAFSDVPSEAITTGGNATVTSHPPVEPKLINASDEILTLVESVQRKLTFKRIGPIGAVLFIWTALSLLSTIETSLNRVFGAPRSRSAVRRVLLYWSAMTLGPVALALAVFVGQRAITAAHDLPVLSWLVVAAGWIGPTLVGVTVLAATYILMPNVYVHRRAAVSGAFVAVLLWLLARWGFAVYVQRFVLQGNLYGILGALPLFLLWLNLSWMIFLFGAELANAGANIKRLETAESDEPQMLTADDAIAVVLVVAKGFETAGPIPASQIIPQVQASAEAVDWLLRRLAQRGVLCIVSGRSEPHYAPGRPAAQIGVGELLDLCDERDGFAAAGIHPAVARVRERVQANVRDLTVADLLAESSSAPAAPVRVIRA